MKNLFRFFLYPVGIWGIFGIFFTFIRPLITYFQSLFVFGFILLLDLVLIIVWLFPYAKSIYYLMYPEFKPKSLS